MQKNHEEILNIFFREAELGIGTKLKLKNSKKVEH